MFCWRGEFAGLGVAFTDVSAGNLALHAGPDRDRVGDNRRRLESELGVASESLRFLHQTHSTTVVRAEDLPPAGSGEVPAADAAVSAAGGTPLAVLVADCVPIVLAGLGSDGAAVSTAVVHAGRRGLAGGIIPAAVNAMRAAGPQRIRAWIGPSICGSCYEVPEQMAAEVAERVPATAARTRRGTAGLDLPAGAAAQLTDLNVRHERVGGCTLEDERLFSHRRSPASGRLAGLIWRLPTEVEG